jgi:hypothetical protein
MGKPLSKTPPKLSVDIVLTIYSVLMLLAALCRGRPGILIDYPCELGLGPQPQAETELRSTQPELLATAWSLKDKTKI